MLHDAVDLFDGPIIVGLTATPPDLDDKPTEEVERYQRLLGELDYEVPVPAVVKDGFITPYQDLAYFVRPTEAELAYVAKADAALHALVEELCRWHLRRCRYHDATEPPGLGLRGTLQAPIVRQ